MRFKRTDRDAKGTQPLSLKPAGSEKLYVGWATDVGRVRGHNEDAILILESRQEGGRDLPYCGLFVLADGMGGHRSGEVASALACRVVATHVAEHVHLPLLRNAEAQFDAEQVLSEAISRAHAAVASSAPGSGTTLTCALVLGKDVTLAHVGDSRAYAVSPDGLSQITRDHSLVDRLVEMGQITADEATRHPQKNVLMRAVGQGDSPEVDTHRQSIAAPGGILLCSDGLWGLVGDAEMTRVIAEAYAPQAACDALVTAANAAGGRDNITAILIQSILE
ncbi:MAG: serine/threonine-protein phosphatase [Anaerolineae bacterium]|nr:serine/threonine-protein phosphatase [Anaerolineae bacterium]